MQPCCGLALHTTLVLPTIKSPRHRADPKLTRCGNRCVCIICVGVGHPRYWRQRERKRASSPGALESPLIASTPADCTTCGQRASPASSHRRAHLLASHGHSSALVPSSSLPSGQAPSCRPLMFPAVDGLPLHNLRRDPPALIHRAPTVRCCASSREATSPSTVPSERWEVSPDSPID